ncbi:MAG: glycosyltransferase family 4 protein, partial [Candidatus Aenigmarchaeota archaeon]|nr:glycosyltransferase family 4 protein [Candidatus Aenigmarchaeota archaeon]
MKICLISNLYNPYVLGGAEIYVEKIANQLSKNNKVIIISTKPYNGLKSLKPSVEIKNNIKIYRFFPLNTYYTYYAKKTTILKKPFWHFIDLWNPHSYSIIKNILKKEKPNIVHTHNLGGFSLSTFNIVKSLNLPLIHTLHDYSLMCPNAMLLNSQGNICKKQPLPCRTYQKIKKQLSKSKPYVVTAPSQFVLDMHRKKGFFPNSKMIKLPLGIESKNNKPIKKNYDNLNILYAGQLSKHKGIHILIEAFKQINNPKIRLNIVGKGPDSEYFQKLADKDSRILFHGFVSDKKLNELYNFANIVVVPSRWYDNSPVVIYESFAHSNLVIGSNIGGIPELIENDKNGFLFEAGNIIELKDIFTNLINNPTKLKELSENAYETSKKYDMDAHINKL